MQGLKPKRSAAYAKDARASRMIDELDSETIREILLNAYIAFPEVETMVNERHADFMKEQREQKSRQPPVNFDACSKTCWHALNTMFKGLRPSYLYDQMGEVFAVLSENREEIVKIADKTTRWETRRNALETLRKICKSIMLCNESLIRYEIMKDGDTLAEFGRDMIILTKGMTEGERKRYEDEALLEKLIELKDFCDTDWPELEELLNIFELGKKQNVTPLPQHISGSTVVVDLEVDSEDEVEEYDRYKALSALDTSRGCICYGHNSGTNSGTCPIHMMVELLPPV